MKPERIQARSLMWAHDFIKAIHEKLGKGITVTHFVLGYEGEEPIEFEIVVTKIGKARVPRITARSAEAAR